MSQISTNLPAYTQPGRSLQAYANAGGNLQGAASREQQLGQQLNDRLTGKLDRIRQQISAPQPAESSSAAKGQRVDILA